MARAVLIYFDCSCGGGG